MKDENEVAKLQESIDLLQHRIDELEIAAELERSMSSPLGLKVCRNTARQSRARYLWNLVAAAIYPLVFGLIRIIYNRAYRPKK